MGGSTLKKRCACSAIAHCQDWLEAHKAGKGQSNGQLAEAPSNELKSNEHTDEIGAKCVFEVDLQDLSNSSILEKWLQSCGRMFLRSIHSPDQRPSHVNMSSQLNGSSRGYGRAQERLKALARHLTLHDGRQILRFTVCTSEGESEVSIGDDYTCACFSSASDFFLPSSGCLSMEHHDWSPKSVGVRWIPMDLFLDAKNPRFLLLCWPF